MNEQTARGAHILIVEDSDVQALELTGILESSGYTVARAATAEAAMDYLNHHVPDLLLADYVLPKMDGQELIRQLRLNERTRALPALLMTGDARHGERAGLESGADAYVLKSRDPQPLLMRVNALLRGRRSDHAESGFQFRRGQVLIADSSPTSRLRLQDILTRDGYVVTARPDLNSALEFIDGAQIDCVIVNLLDPKFDGIEACRILAAMRDRGASGRDARPPFLVVGVGEGKAAGGGLLREAFAAGADEVVSSIADPELLSLRLRALVRRQLVLDEARRLETERMQARAALEQFQVLVQGVTDYAIYMLDANGCVSTWNAGAERIKGYTSEEIIGHHFSEFYTEDERLEGEPARALAATLREGRYETEAQRVRKSGEKFWAHVIIDPIYDERGVLRGFAKITRDITERKKTGEELQAAREALTHAQKVEAIGQLTGGIAHDFNNMLAGIIGALNLVERRIESGRINEVGKFIEAAKTSAHRAAALTSRLLAFGRRQTLDIQPVDVNQVVSSMRILLERTMGEQVQIAVQLDGPEIWATTDVSQLESALLNLAINARDAMPGGGTLSIETSRAEKTRGGRGMVSITVRDTGQGMTTEVLSKVFDPFFTTKPVGQGTGLGLSMVYGFVNQSGGEVNIVSAPGKGTAVTLQLPSGSRAVTPVEQAPPVEEAQTAGETVLVVEDDPQVRMLILEVLKDLGYKALEASGAEEAIKAIERGGRIDLMISDVGLPTMNGRQLAEIVRRRRPNLKVLFITGYVAQAAVKSEFLEPGMDMLMKPFALDALAAKIREIIHPAQETTPALPT